MFEKIKVIIPTMNNKLKGKLSWKHFSKSLFNFVESVLFQVTKLEYHLTLYVK